MSSLISQEDTSNVLRDKRERAMRLSSSAEQFQNIHRYSSGLDCEQIREHMSECQWAEQIWLELADTDFYDESARLDNLVLYMHLAADSFFRGATPVDPGTHAIGRAVVSVFLKSYVASARGGRSQRSWLLRKVALAITQDNLQERPLATKVQYHLIAA